MEPVEPRPYVPPQSHNEYVILRLEEALKMCRESQDVSLIGLKIESILKMARGLEDYLENTSGEETELQKLILAHTMAEPWAENYKNGLTIFNCTLNMVNCRHPTQFMRMMCEITGAENILEVGMFTGYTTAIFCDSPSAKKVFALELDPFVANFVKKRFSGRAEEKKLRIETGPALESIKNLAQNDEVFDLIFIDADKVNYINYYKLIMESGLLKKGGIIMLDNTLWQGEVYPEPSTERGKVFHELNEFIKNDPRVTQVILQISDGITLVRKK